MALSAFLLCAVFLFPSHTWAQNSGNVSVGASITAAETSFPWRSPSGDFAFGFQQLSNNKDLLVLAVWFEKIPDKTIVWYEKGSYPVPRGSMVRLDPMDGIVLRDPHGVLLYSTGGLADPVVYAFMNDTGNFVLHGSGSASLWESFKNPTDTILPTQTIEINGGLLSRVAAANFSEGRFYAKMKSNGNFVLYTKSVPTNTIVDYEYYSTLISDPNASSSGYQLVFDEKAFLAVRNKEGQQLLLSSRSNPPASDYYYRATLDFDGVFAQYYHPRNFSANPRWVTASSWPDNICIRIAGGLGSGACGYNNVCRLENGRPVCQCPRGFSLADPNNTYGHCKPNFMRSCVQGDPQGSPEDEYDLFEISDTDWPYNDLQQIMPSTVEQCRSLCLTDCFCDVAIFRSGSCWKKRLPLSNGKIDTALGAKAFLKFKKRDAPLLNPGHRMPDKQKRDHRILIHVGSALLGTSVFVNCILIGAGCFGFFLIYNKRLRDLNQVHDASIPNLHCFTHKELVQATNGFSEEVGRGSFGIVYKGVIPNGSKTAIAVKKLDRVAQDSEKEFRTEVNIIGQTHHKNLVRLIGFCDKGPHRMLVYEYMNNGTLAGYLFGSPRPSWSQRTQIALGIARGLMYLHEECSTQIIHCDIKPQNVLLDEYYNARISDFGLAKILKMNQSRATLSHIRGTKGYLAPEWYRNTQITAKVDVYSFGVLLLEIITCKRSLDLDQEPEHGGVPILTDWVWDCFVEKKVDSLVTNDAEALSDRRTLERFVMVGIWCIQEGTSARPTMKKVCQMLEGIVEVRVPPCPYPVSIV